VHPHSCCNSLRVTGRGPNNAYSPGGTFQIWGNFVKPVARQENGRREMTRGRFIFSAFGYRAHSAPGSGARKESPARRLTALVPLLPDFPTEERFLPRPFDPCDGHIETLWPCERPLKQHKQNDQQQYQGQQHKADR